MDPALADLISLLELEPIERNIFRGQSQDSGFPQVFGGQVLGQALAAASRTINGRVVHSLHAYFLQRGDVDAPIVYEVDRARDGGSFSSRRVIAIQHGAQIFNMAASFQVPEEGLEHQIAMPEVTPPESLKDIDRFHLVCDVIDRVPGLAARAAHVRQHMRDQRIIHKQYIATHGEDMPGIRHWRWPGEHLPGGR